MANVHYGPYLAKSEQLLMELLAIDTCQPAGNEDRIIRYLAAQFPAGTEWERLVHTETRSSLVVRVPGRTRENALAFVGHVDTVPHGSPENWHYPPGVPTAEGDRIYGRGSSDMKGGVAAMTATALYLLERRIVPARDIYFCYTADEENAGLGARALDGCTFMEQVGEVIIAEPTNGQISIGEKGALWLRVIACGLQSHGSRPELGINAVEMLVELYGRIRAQLNTDAHHPFFGRTTASVTQLHGGIATNIVPAKADMDMDIRLIPGQRNEDMIRCVDQLAQELCREHPPLTLQVEVLNDRPAVEVDRSAPLLKNMLEAVRDLGMDDTLRGTIFYTDASQIVPHHEMPFVILGPGDDKLAHQGDEFITRSSLRQVTALYLHYIERFMEGLES